MSKVIFKVMTITMITKANGMISPYLMAVNQVMEAMGHLKGFK